MFVKKVPFSPLRCKQTSITYKHHSTQLSIIHKLNTPTPLKYAKHFSTTPATRFHFTHNLNCSSNNKLNQNGDNNQNEKKDDLFRKNKAVERVENEQLEESEQQGEEKRSVLKLLNELPLKKKISILSMLVVPAMIILGIMIAELQSLEEEQHDFLEFVKEDAKKKARNYFFKQHPEIPRPENNYYANNADNITSSPSSSLSSLSSSSSSSSLSSSSSSS